MHLSFSKIFQHRIFSGGFIFLFGLGLCIAAFDYDMGTLRQMGPGYFPLTLGLALGVIAIIIMFETRQKSVKTNNDVTDSPSRWHTLAAFILPLLGIFLFAAFIKTAGFLVATFACTLVAALAHRNNKLPTALLLSALVCLFTSIVFVYALGIPVRLVIFS